MKRKFLFSIIVMSIISIFSVVHTFANTDATNTIENMGQDAGNTVIESMDKTRNTVDGAGSMAQNVVDDTSKAVMSLTDSSNNNDFMKMTGNNYDAQRTSTEEYAGITTNTWVWIVTAIALALALGFIWYYSRKHTTNHTND